MNRATVMCAIALSAGIIFMTGSPSRARVIHPWVSVPSPALVSWSPDELVNGSPCLFFVTPPKPLASLKGNWLKRRVFFTPNPVDGSWYGVGGVGVDTPVGPHLLKLEGVTMKDKRISFSHEIRINRAAYPTTELRVARRYTSPGRAAQARIRKEKAVKKKVLSVVTPESKWSGAFLPPLTSTVTSVFGAQRTFNGIRQSIHRGLDYRAEPGMPVSAMNSGSVILAQDLFFEGKCVIIDHGHGLLTLYMHLSEIDVTKGELLKKGQILGLSGATGRVTAPHLHVAVRWHGLYVDPAVTLTLPWPAPESDVS